MGDAFVGSSPLARGALGGADELVCAHGLIPARAGSTLSPSLVMNLYGAHPRSRGEHRPVRLVRIHP